MKLNVFRELKEQAVNLFYPQGFRVILKGEPEYNASREISNSYFDKEPDAIAFPRTAEQVKTCFDYCINRNELFRIRSGGHQHEGMSSLDGGLVIRLSDMSLIKYCNEDNTEAWIDSGMKLGTVYSELALNGKIIPAGGCFNVNVGGITQGGGWGLHSRKYGLTCDNIVAAEIVLFDGRIVTVSANNESDLFWALRGGGGGNFGIVTRFKFKLSDKGANISRFAFGWRQDKVNEVAKAWLDLQKDYPDRLTSFVRFAVTESNAPGDKQDCEYEASDFPVYAGGLFYGKKAELKEIMAPLIEAVTPNKPEYKPEEKDKGKVGLQGTGAAASPVGLTDLSDIVDLSMVDLFAYDDFTSAPLSSTLFSSEENSESSSCNVTPPSITCNVPHPHKVSSAFPLGSGDKYNSDLAKAIADYMTRDDYDYRYVRSYLTLHSMGGAIAEKAHKDGSSFAYRDKAFLLQMQSWWNYPNGKDKDCRKDNKEQQMYIDWVTGFRKSLADDNLVEGAFINFVDKDLPIEKEGSKHELLSYYYKGNLEKLIEIKSKYDPENKFNFEMSIPNQQKE